MIDRDHKLPVTQQAKLLKVSRGSVYYLPKPVSAVDLALMRRIDELHLKHPFMGTRMLRDQLAREEIYVGRCHIGTLMRRMGIEALAPQPDTSKAGPGTRSTRTCCTSLPSCGPTRSGHWTPPTFPWRTALSTSPPLSMSPVAGC